MGRVFIFINIMFPSRILRDVVSFLFRRLSNTRPSIYYADILENCHLRGIRFDFRVLVLI